METENRLPCLLFGKEERGLRKALRIVLAALTALCVLLPGPGALALTMHREVENPELELEAVLGYDGVITYGKPIPVRVTVRNLGADFDGVLGMNCYVNRKQYDRYERTVSLPSGAEKEIVMTVSLEARQDVFTLELTKDQEVVRAVNLRAGRVINPSAMMIGVLSTRPEQLKNLDIGQENDDMMRYEYWQTVALTTETFPADRTQLDAFGMLVIDDIDPALLSEAQQQAMEAWLRNGHILICGGGTRAAKNVGYFRSLTGLKTGILTLSDGITGALEQLLGLEQSGKGPQAAIAEITGETPLAADPAGRGLIWRTQVGAGVLYTAAFEAGDRLLNAEALMHSFWQQLLIKQDPNLYNNILYFHSDYNPAAVTVNRSIPVKSPMLPAVLIAAGVPVLGFGLWLLLKKKDKQQWMWLALPVLAGAAAGALAVTAGGSGLNQPMTVTAVSLVQEEGAPVRSWSGIMLNAPEKGIYRLGVEGGALRVSESYYYYYDSEDENKITEPVQLRTCHTDGAESTVSVSVSRPWDTVSMTVERVPETEGRVETSIRMEADGLHGEIRNGTNLSLKEGWVLTGYGYTTVPALAPGEAAAFSLILDKVNNNGDPAYEPGKMYDSPNASVYGMISTIAYGTNGYYYNENETPEDQEKNALYSMLNGVTEQIRQDGRARAGKTAYDDDWVDYVYCAQPEAYPETILTMNGKPVEMRTETVMFGAEITAPEMPREWRRNHAEN